jgi:acyl-coenzyme A thioesterase PaaI-like protein
MSRDDTGMSEPRLADFPDLGLNGASRFVAALGLVFDVVRGDLVTGRVTLGPQHHDAWGTVHRGVYSTIVERAASVGASRAVAGLDRFAVGLHNATNVFVATTGGDTDVLAEPQFQSENQQLWAVVIRDRATECVLARGELRLQNVPRRDVLALT